MGSGRHIAGATKGQSECRLWNGDRKKGIRRRKKIELAEGRGQLGGLLKLLGLQGGGAEEIESQELWNHRVEMFWRQLG